LSHHIHCRRIEPHYLRDRAYAVAIAFQVGRHGDPQASR
jgi:hypothetical protein